MSKPSISMLMHTRSILGERSIPDEAIGQYCFDFWLTAIRSSDEFGFNEVEYIEHALVLIFDCHKRPVGFTYQRGLADSVQADLPAIIAFAHEVGGKYLIDCHSHPPGSDALPSHGDRRIWSWMRTVYGCHNLILWDALVFTGLLTTFDFYSDAAHNPSDWKRR